MRMDGPLTAERVRPLLAGRFGRDVWRWFESCPSTQLELMPDDADGAVAVAEEQTAGRGRLGRAWHAPPGTSILCSVLLRPDAEPARLPELTVLGARAVGDAIGAVTGLEPTIKHPNDVLVRGRKVAGVLGEARDGVVVVGIGVNANVSAADLPAETRLPATSLLVERAEPVDRARLLAQILGELEARYDAWRRWPM